MSANTPLASDVAALARTSATSAQLGQAARVEPLPARVGKAQATAGGTGITSPLTETAYADRETYDVALLTTASGWFAFEVRTPMTIKFKDGEGNKLDVKFAEPTA